MINVVIWGWIVHNRTNVNCEEIHYNTPITVSHVPMQVNVQSELNETCDNMKHKEFVIFDEEIVIEGIGLDVRLGVSASSFSAECSQVIGIMDSVKQDRTNIPPVDVTTVRRLADLCEPNVVTELPKPLFKKPKLRDNYSATGLDWEDAAKLRRPEFGKRNVKKKVDNPGYKISFSL
ncbi:hypothetical protein Tco_1009190 [Tanacetum coccineum]